MAHEGTQERLRRLNDVLHRTIEQGTITPDGSRLIFTRIGDQGRRQIFALPLNEGSAPQALTPDNWDCSTYLYIP